MVTRNFPAWVSRMHTFRHGSRGPSLPDPVREHFCALSPFSLSFPPGSLPSLLPTSALCDICRTVAGTSMEHGIIYEETG